MSEPVICPPFVFKIFRREEWNAFEESGHFDGSPDDVRDGFIHLSTEEQLAGTVEKHFAGDESVVIARIESAGLPIRMVVSRAGMHFPHLYGALERSAVVDFEIRQLVGQTS